jgi:preprotein translocase subunit SecY
MNFKNILSILPEVEGPKEKRLSFNVKLKWTLIVLISFFVLANIPLYGLAQNSLDRFKHLAVILGTNFGSIISLGIGPIVMASIILQLLVGSKILDIDMNTDEGRKYFSGLQKLLVFFFIIFEAIVYVLMRGLQAAPGLTGLVIFQLILGGLVIVFMDELVQKWGFGQGVSLFIAAGVGWRLFTGAFQFLGPEGNLQISGQVLVVITSVLAGSTLGALKALAAILSTAIIFLIVVWAQSLKVEVPLSFDRLRGYSIKWPLSFFYASVIPVILTAALVANLQLFGSLIQNWLGHPTFLGNFVGGTAVGGLAFWLSPINLLDAAITGSLDIPTHILKGLTHILFYMVFATIFSIFWVKTSGMDAQSQAKNILSRGLQISGFRKDRRILESVLSRYILPLTVMGGAAVGLLAAAANLLGALVSGTALLLGIMIMFQFYQNIAQQHAMDMHPALKKFMG